MLNSYIQFQVPVKCTDSTQKYALRMFNDMMICPTGASFLALAIFGRVNNQDEDLTVTS